MRIYLLSCRPTSFVNSYASLLQNNCDFIETSDRVSDISTANNYDIWNHQSSDCRKLNVIWNTVSGKRFHFYRKELFLIFCVTAKLCNILLHRDRILIIPIKSAQS